MPAAPAREVHLSVQRRYAFGDFQLNYLDYRSRRLIPSTRIYQEGELLYRTNSLGCVGEEIGPGPVVAFFGDSCTHGYAGGSFVDHVALPGCQILNAGIEGLTLPWIADRFLELREQAPLVCAAVHSGWHNIIYNQRDETNQRQESLSRDEKGRLWAVDFAFKQTAERDWERQSAGEPPRRALVVNGIHNFFEPVVMASLSVTLTPYSSRLRHGYFTDPAKGRLARASEAERDAAARLSRRTSFTPAELDHLDGLASQLESGSDPSSWRAAGRMAAEIDALVQSNWPRLSRDSEEWRTQLLDRLAEARPSRAAPIRAGLVSPAAGATAASRLARIEDWERPDWARLARLLFPGRPHDHLFERDLWVWERVSLVDNLRRRFPVGSGATVLLVGRLPEALISALAALDYEVDVVDQWSISGEGYESVDWRADDSMSNRMFRKPIGAAADRPADYRWDAAIACQNGLYARGPDGVVPILEAIARRVKVGGHLGACTLVQLDSDERRPLPTAFPSPLLLDDALTKALETHVHLASRDGADLRITPHTLDRQSETDRSIGAAPGLVFNRPPILETFAVLGLTKTAEADAEEWRSLSRWLEAARVGRLID